MNGQFITTKEAKKTLQVCEYTLRRWADSGLFPSIRTPGGQRLYNIQQFLQNKTEQSGSEEPKQSICYCRVSSQGQKDDLQRQITYMQEKFPNHRIITDIGSGINFRRKGLCTILELSSKGLVSEVVVAYRDRLCRFAFELVQRFFQLHGTRLVVLNQEVDSSGQSELAEDLLAIVNVFNCRVNGKQKYKNKKQNEQTQEVHETSSQPVQESTTSPDS
jgi:predicted site-specific integrase-resolvase